MASVAPIAPSPATTLLHWLDGTAGDDHAAMAAIARLTGRAQIQLAPDQRPVPWRSAETIVAHVLMALRDADSEAVS